MNFHIKYLIYTKQRALRIQRLANEFYSLTTPLIVQKFWNGLNIFLEAVHHLLSHWKFWSRHWWPKAGIRDQGSHNAVIIPNLREWDRHIAIVESNNCLATRYDSFTTLPLNITRKSDNSVSASFVRQFMARYTPSWLHDKRSLLSEQRAFYYSFMIMAQLFCDNRRFSLSSSLPNVSPHERVYQPFAMFTEVRMFSS